MNSKVAASALFVALLVPIPPARATTPWRLIMVGDSRGATNGVNVPILTEIAARIVTEQPDLVLFPGDLVTGSTDQATLTSQLTNWRTVMQPVYDAGIQVLAIRGNHENQGSVDAWNAVFTGAYAMPGNGPAGEVNVTYSLVHNNAFIAGLDVYSGHSHKVNQAWLDSQLVTNTTRPHVFVFAHEPAYKADHVDCLDDFPADRDAFWTSIANAGGRTYCCGHDHFYDHARIDDQDGNLNDDLHQVSVGTAGAPLRVFCGVYDGLNDGMIPVQQYDASSYGYVTVDLDGLQVTLTWVQRIDADNFVPMETWSYAAEPKPGDLNCDGEFDLADVEAFTLALLDPAAYEAAYPGCNIMLADMDGNGSVDGLDIEVFVARLMGG
jgi:hypothetical protein